MIVVVCRLRPALAQGRGLTAICLNQALWIAATHPVACQPSLRGISSKMTKRRSYWRSLQRMVLDLPTPPYSNVCQVGDPILRVQASPVEPSQIAGEEVQAVIRKLVRVMRKEKCVALSAPQLGVPLRIIVVEYPKELYHQHPPNVREIQQMSPFPLRIFVNPAMKVLNNQTAIFPEGCRSVGAFSACVPRYLAVEVSGLNEAGEETSWQASGWAARIIQHEMDHLQGILYIDKMDSQTFVNIHWAEVND